jgi:hypothetical protein
MKDKKIKEVKKDKKTKPLKNNEASIKAPAAEKKVDKKIIENHKKAAAHHMEAAKLHLEAAKHYEAGNSEKAAHFAHLAHGHFAIAGDFLTDNAKHHAQTLKQTNYHF